MKDHDWTLHEVHGTVCLACGRSLPGNAATTCPGPTEHTRRLLDDIAALQAVALRLAGSLSAMVMLKHDIDLSEALAGVRGRPRETLAALEQAMDAIYPTPNGSGPRG
jgi:hypothetical protein